MTGSDNWRALNSTSAPPHESDRTVESMIGGPENFINDHDTPKNKFDGLSASIFLTAVQQRTKWKYRMGNTKRHSCLPCD
jgi:hypothetical protein